MDTEHAMYLTYLILLGLCVLCNTILLVVFYRHSQKNITTVSLFILLMLVNLWFIPKFLTNAFHIQGPLFESLSRISALGYIFVPAVLLTFAVSFGASMHIFRRIPFWFFIFLPPVILLYFSWTSNLVGVHDYHQAVLYPWGYETPTGAFWAHYMVWYDIMIMFSIVTLIRHYRTMIDQTKKRQTLYFIFAMVFPLIVNTFTVGILPIFNIFIFPIGLILIDVVTVVGIALIIRYGWFEVSPFIILSNMNQALLTVDTKGRIIQANPFAEKLLRKPMAKINGISVDKLLFIRHEDNRMKNHTMQLVKLVLSRGKSMTFDSYSMYLDKKQALTDIVSITPIFDERLVVGANIFFRDTRKEKVREKQKEDYFSVLFHELKSPMTSIKAYNQVLARRFSDTTEENKQLFKNVDQQLDRLTRLINDFFELSRLQAGKVTLKKEFFGVDDFVQGIIETMKITHKNRTFTIHGHTNSVVYADKDKIEQILINFINNALKFSPENAAIDLHLQADGHKVTIGVQDYGRGIDPKFHKKIFERFFQVNPVSKQRIGLGVGLSIISSIVKAHEGKVWVDSNIGKGSTFYFSLPISKLS